MFTSDARCTREIESRIAMVKAASDRKKTVFYKQIGLKFKEETLEIPAKFWNIVLEKDGEDRLERSCEKWVKKDRNIPHTIKRRPSGWIGHILRRNCFIKHIIEGKIEQGIEVAGRQEIRSKQLLNDLKETIGNWKLKEEALYLTVWRTRFGRRYGPVVILTTGSMNE